MIMVVWPQRTLELERQVDVSCELLDRFWELDSSPLEEQSQALSNRAISLTSVPIILVNADIKI